MSVVSNPPLPAYGRNNSIDPATLALPRRQLRGARRNQGIHNSSDESGLTDESFASKLSQESTSTFSHESVKFFAKNFVNQKSGRLESQYRIGERLGEGGFGEVFSVTHLETGEQRAVKVMEKSKKDPKVNEDIVREYSILKELDHPNILKVYEMYETKSHFFIVTDLYSGGDLFSDLEDYGCFEEKDAAQLMNTILTCMNYCHKRNLVHLDLKPENVLLAGRGKDYRDVKIIDFGLAKYQDENTKLTSMVGSSYYMAPQVVKRSYIGSKADVWSCGIICHVMMTGIAPFDGPDILDSIVRGELDFDGEEWDDTSEEVKDFIRSCLTYDEEKRPTSKEALMHPFIKKYRRRATSRKSISKKRNSARNSLRNLNQFACTHSKLKQASCMIMAAQLLSQEEKDGIDDVFRDLDTGCDGLLDEEELKRAYKEYYKVPISDEEMKKIFTEVNISGSGAISYSEFAIAVLMTQQMVDEDKLHAAFNIFDDDGKGHISSDDIKRVLMLGDGHDEYLKKKILRQVDAEETGMIEYKQFEEIMLSKSPIKKRAKHNRSGAAVAINRTPRRASLLSSSGEIKVDLNEFLNASLLDASFLDSSDSNFSSVTHFSKASAQSGQTENHLTKSSGQSGQTENYRAGLHKIDDDEDSSSSAGSYDDSSQSSYDEAM